MHENHRKLRTLTVPIENSLCLSALSLELRILLWHCFLPSALIHDFQVNLFHSFLLLFGMMQAGFTGLESLEIEGHCQY